MKTMQLTSDLSIPVLGFGTWQLTGEDCTKGVAEALNVGYRHIDTADAYGNHREVGGGIRNSSVKREEIFITSKIWNTDHAHDAVIESTQRFLKELGIGYLDLLLIHWPSKEVPVAETLSAMNELKSTGLIRTIGVSNFTPHHLEDALKAGVEIVDNQIETHPLFNQQETRAYCASKNIAVTAYSPLGHGHDLEEPVILKLAEKYAVSPAQVALNWVLNRGMIAIPKSAHLERIRDNFNATTWTMEEADLARIDALPQGPRTCDPPFNEFDY